jgi:hypothetical protein
MDQLDGSNSMSLNQEIEQWESEVSPILGSLMSILDVAQPTIRSGPTGLLFASDQLRAASDDALGWMPDHRCPVGDLDLRFRQIARSCGNAAKVLEFEASNPNGPDLLAIDREMQGLRATIAYAVAMLRDPIPA